MSTQRTGFRNSPLSPLALLVLAAGAAAASIYSVLGGPAETRIILAISSIIPLVVLFFLIFIIWGAAGSLDRRMSGDLRDAEGLASVTFARLAPVEPAGRSRRHAGSENLYPVAQRVLNQVAASGEGMRVGVLQQRLSEQVMRITSDLERFGQIAVGVGIAGTAFGVGAQVFIAQQIAANNFEGSGFFTGVILKASASVVGLAVSFWANGLRWGAIAVQDRTVELMCSAASRNPAPELKDAIARVLDPDALARAIATALRVYIAELGPQLTAAVRNGMEESLRIIERFLTDNLKPTFEAVVTTPLRTAIGECTTQIKSAQTQVGSSVARLEVSIAALTAAQTAATPATKVLTDVVAALRGLSVSFLDTADRTSKAGKELEAAAGAVMLATDKLVDKEKSDVLHTFVLQLQQVTAELRAAQAEALQVVGARLSGAGPHNGNRV